MSINLGDTVRLRAEVLTDDFREGTVIGFGWVHPSNYPYPVDTAPAPVVLVSHRDGVEVRVWGPDAIETV